MLKDSNKSFNSLWDVTSNGQVVGVLEAMPSSNLKPENEDEVCIYVCFK